MKAMIFAAGLGTRLRPLTDNCPKALIEVGGQPMLQRVILRLKQAGVSEMVINVHHLAPMVTKFLADNHNFGLNIHISDESTRLLDTGGAVLRARRWLDIDEPFMIHNADLLTDLDLSAMASAHLASQAEATLLVAQRNTSRYLLFDSQSTLRGWTNTTTGEVIPQGLDTAELTPLAFGGIHIFSPTLFPLLQQWADGREAFPIVPFYLHAAATGHKLTGYQPAQAYHWLDIGRPDTLAKARELCSTHP